MKEKLSALMDGELSFKEVDSVLSTLHADPSLLDDWLCWQQIRNTLQRQPPIYPTFMDKFSDKLEKEQIVIEPAQSKPKQSDLNPFLVPIVLAASFSFVAIKIWRRWQKKTSKPHNGVIDFKKDPANRNPCTTVYKEPRLDQEARNTKSGMW